MAPWTDVEKAFCVRLYTKTGSILQTQQKFRHYFNLRRCPAKNSIFKWSNKFEMFGSTENRHRKRAGQATNSGRPKTKTTPENAAIVFQSVQADHEKSIRRRSQELSLSRSSVHRILHSNLQMQSFSLQVKQRLNDQDKGQRVLMCQWCRERLRCEPDFLDNVWFTDEAHFYLSGHVSSQSAFYWGRSPPEYVLERPLHAEKCTAWAALSTQGIIGPIWFVDDENETTTINAERYMGVLKQFFVKLKRKHVDVDSQWFMQDGATPHTANCTLQWLRSKFQDRIISRRTTVEWAPHSPDLNPCNFYLWGYLKAVSYRGKPADLEELKQAVEETVRGIPMATCKAVIANFAKRVERCLAVNGTHFEHMPF